VADAVGVAVIVAVRVADAVGVALAVRVAVVVAVAVLVAVGVGRLCFLAEPVKFTLADVSPAVASLVTLTAPVKLLPESGGANSTVTVVALCGWTRNAPCPDVILKGGLPFAGATVTESAIPPASSTRKDLLSDVWLERSILSNASVVGVTTILLTCARLATSALVAWVCALVADRIAAAKMNAVAQVEDANRSLRCTIVSRPPSRIGPGGPAKNDSPPAPTTRLQF
jgi:hypothetical protein